MKLATYKSDLLDGKLVVVNRDMTLAVDVEHIAQTMQIALENWEVVAPILNAIYTSLNQGRVQNAFDFDIECCLAPLPRAYYCSHAQLDAENSSWRFEQARSDNFVYKPYAQAFKHADKTATIQIKTGVAVVSNAIAEEQTLDPLADHICLLMLVNEVSCLEENTQHKIATRVQKYFSPVAVTLDELNSEVTSGVEFSIQYVLNQQCQTQTNTIDLKSALSSLTYNQALPAGSVIYSFINDVDVSEYVKEAAFNYSATLLTDEEAAITGYVCFKG